MIHTSARAAIAQAEAKALGWIAGNLRFFDPSAPWLDNDGFFHSLKAAAELALLCSCGRTDSEHRSAYEGFASFVWEEVFSVPALQDRLLRNPTAYAVFSLYQALHDCGYHDEAFRGRLEAILRDEYVLNAEQIPTMELNLVYSVGKLGYDVSAPPLEELYRRTVVGRRSNVYRLKDVDVYALTHALFFVTDFARSPCQFFTRADELYLADALPRLTGYYIREGNCDLLGELLMCLKATGHDQLPEFRDGWAFLLCSQNEDGSFPGPEHPENGNRAAWFQPPGPVSEAQRSVTTSLEDSAERPPPPPEWRTFMTDYHTTLVALFAANVAG